MIEHREPYGSNMVAVLLAATMALDAASPARPACGDVLANALAVYWLERYAAKTHVPAAGRGGLPRYRLKRVIEYLDENLSGDLTLARLAAVAGMSPHYFAELFRQSTGRTPHQYVLMRRIVAAKENLRGSRRSVIEVGLEVGFQNPSHFARVFRKWVGISPSGFRSESRRNYSTDSQGAAPADGRSRGDASVAGSPGAS